MITPRAGLSLPQPGPQPDREHLSRLGSGVRGRWKSMDPRLDFEGWQSGDRGAMPGMIFGYHFSLEEIPDRFTWTHW